MIHFAKFFSVLLCEFIWISEPQFRDDQRNHNADGDLNEPIQCDRPNARHVGNEHDDGKRDTCIAISSPVDKARQPFADVPDGNADNACNEHA